MMTCRLCRKPQARWRSRLGAWLYKWADRIDHHGGDKMTGYSMKFVPGKGLVFSLGRDGCLLMYRGHEDYERAHNG